MNRRNFLQSMFAAAMAPAICKAENLMKIYVPNRDIQIINSFGADSMKFDGRGDYIPFSDIDMSGDFTLESWIKNGSWTLVSVKRENNQLKEFINGEEVPHGINSVLETGTVIEYKNGVLRFNPQFQGEISDLKIYDIALPTLDKEQLIK